MNERNFFQEWGDNVSKAGNFARDAAYYTRALTNVLPNQTWTRPGPALRDSLLTAYEASAARGDGRNIKYPDWTEDPVGKRIIGQANTRVENGKLIVDDTYDFYDQEVSKKYQDSMDATIKKAWEDKDWDYLAQTYATQLYKGKQKLMPWANPKIHYEIPLPNATVVEGVETRPSENFITKNLEGLNNFLGGMGRKDAPDTPSMVTALDPSYGSYEVQAGENLTNIARQHKMTLEELLALNKGISNPNLVQVGQRLKVKGL